MKCKTTRAISADVNCHPPYVTTDVMGRKVIAAGTVICRDEFPLADCVKLVLNGLAVPEDEECRAGCNRSESDLAAAREAMDNLLAGKLFADEDDEDEEPEEEDD